MASQDPPDLSQGWNEVASEFIAVRASGNVGLAVAQAWADELGESRAVLDLGCGNGIPVSNALIEAGHTVWGVDASATMAAEFKKHFPTMAVACEPVETSRFFDRTFDGVVAIGLMFLLPPDAQRRLISRVGDVLNPGGRFLFTAPHQVGEWSDTMTGRQSHSLGEDIYRSALAAAGLLLIGQYFDEGGNHYFHAHRPSPEDEAERTDSHPVD